MDQFFYKNVKNSNINYLLRKFDYEYYFCIFFEKKN